MARPPGDSYTKSRSIPFTHRPIVIPAIICMSSLYEYTSWQLQRSDHVRVNPTRCPLTPAPYATPLTQKTQSAHQRPLFAYECNIHRTRYDALVKTVLSCVHHAESSKCMTHMLVVHAVQLRKTLNALPDDTCEAQLSFTRGDLLGQQQHKKKRL